MKRNVKDGSRRLPLYLLLSYKLKRSWGAGLFGGSTYYGANQYHLNRYGTWRGKDGRMWDINKQPNGITGKRTGVLAQAKKLKYLGYGTATFSSGISAYLAFDSYRANGYVVSTSTLVYSTDTVMGLVGMTNPVGFTVSTIYFGGRFIYDSGLLDSRGSGYSRSTNIYTGDAWRSWARPVSTGTMLPNFRR